MKKRKTIWKAALLVTGIAFVMDRIRVHKKMKELNKRITKVGHCHNQSKHRGTACNYSGRNRLRI